VPVGEFGRGFCRGKSPSPQRREERQFFGVWLSKPEPLARETPTTSRSRPDYLAHTDAPQGDDPRDTWLRERRGRSPGQRTTPSLFPGPERGPNSTSAQDLQRTAHGAARSPPRTRDQSPARMRYLECLLSPRHKTREHLFEGVGFATASGPTGRRNFPKGWRSGAVPDSSEDSSKVSYHNQCQRILAQRKHYEPSTSEPSTDVVGGVSVGREALFRTSMGAFKLAQRRTGIATPAEGAGRPSLKQDPSPTRTVMPVGVEDSLYHRETGHTQKRKFHPQTRSCKALSAGLSDTDRSEVAYEHHSGRTQRVYFHGKSPVSPQPSKPRGRAKSPLPQRDSVPRLFRWVP